MATTAVINKSSLSAAQTDWDNYEADRLAQVDADYSAYMAGVDWKADYEAFLAS